MSKTTKYTEKPFWAEGTSLTRKQIQRISNSSHSVAILSEAKRKLIQQRKEIEELKAAIKMRGEFQR